MTDPKAEQQRKTLFAWASIAGADAEPVELIEQDGRKGVLTFGCPDPFWLDDDVAGVVVYANDLSRPKSPETPEQQAERQAKYEAKKPYGHSWRGPR